MRDGSLNARRAHANALTGSDLTLIRSTGERTLTLLACGWDEDTCPQ